MNGELFAGDFKQICLLLGSGIFAFELYLSLRQHWKIVSVTKRPAELTFFTDEDFHKTRLYSLDKSYFSILSAIFHQLLHVGTIWWDLLPLLWSITGQWSLRLLLLLGSGTQEGSLNIADHEITHSLAFLTTLTVINTILSIPWSLYSTFVIEERHGFNKQTLGLFLSDLAKSLLLGGLIGLPCAAGFLWVVRNTGHLFPIYLGTLAMTVQLTLLFIYPTFIQPLFNKVTPLAEGELKSKIEALASKVSFPLTRIYVIDGSRRSGHSNAYFYGLFNNKRIVLYDTLIEQMENHDQILAVLGHEIGHWFHSHMSIMIVVSQIHLFLLFYLFSLLSNDAKLLGDFGFAINAMQSSGQRYLPAVISFILFSYIYSPVDSLLTFLTHVLSRHNEFQADQYAVRLGRGKQLQKALQIISKENRGMVWPDWLFSAWHHTHPPVLERIERLKQLVSKQK